MKKQQRSIGLFAGLLTLGVLMATAAWYFMDMKESVLIGVLVFGPIIVFLFFSGYIGEVGYKDFKLVFREAADQSIDGDFGTIAPSKDDLIQVGDQGVNLLEEMLAHYSLSEEKPILMVI